MGALCLTFIVYRRRRNLRLATKHDDPNSMYASQLGIPICNFQVMASNTTGLPFQISYASFRKQESKSVSVSDVSKPQAHGSRVYSKDTSDGYKVAHVNPLSSNLVANSATRAAPSASGERPSKQFSLNQWQAVQRQIGSHPVSSVFSGVETSSVTGSTQAAYEMPSTSQPQVMFLDVSAERETLLEKIRVVSVSSPKLGTGERKQSASGNAVIHVALASSVNTQAMSRLDRTKLKLRQWKAKLLAEPPPLVEIEVDTSTSKTSAELDNERATESKVDMQRPKDRTAQLEFAKRDQCHHFDTLLREAKEKREKYARTVVSKKEFGPILPSHY
eukprot:gb/GECG01002526.1/.p1 GENE.gb/GECG01002526.1/~~gb/GECG01002526.1/.p1  ORF type:complete len:332 (+),score=43.84 gb/GECG01002526.1/:1-996(+)